MLWSLQPWPEMRSKDRNQQEYTHWSNLIWTQVIGSATEDAASAAEEAVESVAAATIPLRLQELWRQADGLHKPFGLVFASAHILGTACALTGAHPATSAPHVHRTSITLREHSVIQTCGANAARTLVVPSTLPVHSGPSSHLVSRQRTCPLRCNAKHPNLSMRLFRDAHIIDSTVIR